MKTKSFLLSILLLVFAGSINAQKKKPGKGPKAQIVSKRVIRRTATVIAYAHKKVKENKVYTGNLAKAVRHQRYARFLYRNGKFARSIHHSRRARQLAFLAIQANKGTVESGLQLTKDEAPVDSTVSDADLEKELPLEELKEEDLVNAIDPDVDLGENE